MSVAAVVRFTLSLGLASCLGACGGAAIVAGPGVSMPPASNIAGAAEPPAPKPSHIVVIIQENRSLDNLFNGFPKANTVRYGKSTHGHVELQPRSLAEKFDPYHFHSDYLLEYNKGAMNGFNHEPFICKRNKCSKLRLTAYAYVPESQVQPYWDMAKQYILADDMFQTNQGPSYPAHQYLISGTSSIANGSLLKVSSNAISHDGHVGNGGCDSRPGTTVTVINQQGKQNKTVFPCFVRVSIMDLLDAAGVSWKYYQAYAGSGAWNGPDSIKQIWQKPEFRANVVFPPTQVLRDVAKGRLAAVSFVTPTAKASDHALSTNGTGPSWVASVVNAIGESPYWNSTTILLTWDDWGGWYDHVKPAQYNSYELGFRVPLVVISPYAKSGYISSKPHEFGSLLKYIEEAFGLGSLGTTDVRSDDLSDCFSKSRTPRRFKPIQAEFGPQYFLAQPLDPTPADDD